MFNIPKIVHHIAVPKDKSKWFPLWIPCYDSWLKEFPNFNHMIWDDSNLLDFVKTYYYEWLIFYKKLPFNIMRYDVARLLLLHHYGGIYSDMDVFCYKNFEKKITCDFLICKNLISTKNVFGHTDNVNTWLIISSKNNNFFINCIEEIKFRIENFKINLDQNDKQNFHWNISFLTGPFLVSYLFKKALFNNSNLLPSKNFCEASSYNENLYARHMKTSVWTGYVFGSNMVYPGKEDYTENYNFYKKTNFFNYL